jgi:hypothetical protein
MTVKIGLGLPVLLLLAFPRLEGVAPEVVVYYVARLRLIGLGLEAYGGFDYIGIREAAQGRAITGPVWAIPLSCILSKVYSAVEQTDLLKGLLLRD